MKTINIKTIFVILTFSLLIMGCQDLKEGTMRHIVIFKFKPTATEVQIEKVTNALADLKNTIPGIMAFEHGINNSPENKNQGFTHVYQFTFKDMEARDTYLPHPEHKQFGKMLGGMQIVEDVFVVDYFPADN